MSPTERFPIAEDAIAYRKSHDIRVRALNRMTMPTLRDINATQLLRKGIQRLSGGPWSKDELITEIIRREYPIELLNEAIHVIYHKPGENWSACAHCPPAERELDADRLLEALGDGRALEGDSEILAELADALDLASDQGQKTWLVSAGKRIAAIVPVDVAL